MRKRIHPDNRSPKKTLWFKIGLIFIGLCKMFSHWFLPINIKPILNHFKPSINYHIQSIKIWRCNAECADLIFACYFACYVWCHTSHTDVKTPVIGKCKQNQSQLN